MTLYWGLGNLSVIYPRSLGTFIVFSNPSFSISNDTSILSSVPVKWLSRPGMAKIFSQLGLATGDTYRQFLTMNYKSFEYNEGTGSYNPLRTLWYNPFMFGALNGGLRVNISYRTHPKDHISLLWSYGLSFHTSGDA